MAGDFMPSYPETGRAATLPGRRKVIMGAGTLAVAVAAAPPLRAPAASAAPLPRLAGRLHEHQG